jgi:hypothetical protein
MLSGCNFFGSIDSPSGDDQLLAAARACFDRGDYECAAKYYGELSSSASDQAISESAFELLAQSGATSSVFIQAALDGEGSGGKIVTKLANSLISSASQSSRLNIVHAFQKYVRISDTNIQGLTRLITSMTLLAEILAEGATSSSLKQTDLALSPTECITNISQAIPTFTGCSAPTQNKIVTGTEITSLLSATDSQMSGSPTLYMMNLAITEMDAGVKQLQAKGNVGESSGAFATQILAISATALSVGTDAPLYRGTLIKGDVGEK